MSLSLLEVLFDAQRSLDARFWMDVAARLADEGYGLLFREDSADFDAEFGWLSIADGHYPEPGTHGFLLCDRARRSETREARLQVNVYRSWDPHDEPWALAWDPETTQLLHERHGRLEVQLLRIGAESTEFGETFVHAAAEALDGILDDEANGSVILPDGALEPYPEKEKERTPSILELTNPGMVVDEKTPEDGAAPAEAEDDPNDPALRFDLECRQAFTPQHAYDELLRRVKGLLPYKGFSTIRADVNWEMFGFADRDATGLTVLFRRLDEAQVEVTFDLYKTFDPSPERIAKIHKLAHGLLDELCARLEATAVKAP